MSWAGGEVRLRDARVFGLDVADSTPCARFLGRVLTLDDVLGVIRPTLEKMATIAARATTDQADLPVYLVGGSSSFAQAPSIFEAACSMAAMDVSACVSASSTAAYPLLPAPWI